MTMLVPFPTSLTNDTVAPCTAALCLTMERPKPVPPVSRAWLWSTR